MQQWIIMYYLLSTNYILAFQRCFQALVEPFALKSFFEFTANCLPNNRRPVLFDFFCLLYLLDTQNAI